jgi:hypothetical protein
LYRLISKKQDLYETSLSFFSDLMYTQWLRTARPKRSVSFGASWPEDESKTSFRNVDILKIRRWAKFQKNETLSVNRQGSSRVKRDYEGLNIQPSKTLVILSWRS